MKPFGLILLSLDSTQGKCDDEEDDEEDDKGNADSNGNHAKIYVTPLQGGDIIIRLFL